MKYWTQRDGTQIAVEDMTDEHLQNAKAMVERGVTITRDRINTVEAFRDRAREEVKALRARLATREKDVEEYERRLRFLDWKVRVNTGKRDMLTAEQRRRARPDGYDAQGRPYEIKTASTALKEAERLAALYQKSQIVTEVHVNVPPGTGRIRFHIHEEGK